MTTSTTSFSDALKHLKERLNQVAQVRANPSMLEELIVNYQGYDMTLNQLASISVEDPRTMVVQPWDKGSIQSIEKAIYAADMGLAPQTQDALIRVKLPELTAELRDRIIKKINEEKETARISVRTHRDHEWHSIQEQEKNKEITEDQKFKMKDDLDKQAKEANDQIESVAQAKITEARG